ncbi:hypothetical protein MnTg04_00924 [bacterium MnTg04]|nr:hypothetical protein MnTg04_00924 [bacterium MnTg04]
MKCDKGAAPVLGGKLGAGIKNQRIGRPVRRESHQRIRVFAIRRRFFAIPAIFGPNHAPIFQTVVIGIGPAKIGTLEGQVKFLGRQFLALVGAKKPRPKAVELIPPMHDEIQFAGSVVESQRHRVADTGHIALTIGDLVLVQPFSGKLPDTAAAKQMRAGVLPLRARRAGALLARVRRRPRVYEQSAIGADRQRLRRVRTLLRKPGYDDFQFTARDQPIIGEFHPVNRVIR